MAINRRRLIAIASVLAVILIAGVSCLVRMSLTSASGEPGSVHGATGTDGTPGTSASGVPSPTAGGGAAGGGGPPRPKVVVSVGGVRLDGTSPEFSCAPLEVDGLTAPAKVVSQGLAGVSGAPGLYVDGSHCLGDGNIQPKLACAGTTLSPGVPKCWTGVRTSTPSEKATAYSYGQVVVVLRVVCTGGTGVPCGAPEVRAHDPSPPSPVEAEFTVTSRRLQWPQGTLAVPEESPEGPEASVSPGEPSPIRPSPVEPSPEAPPPGEESPASGPAEGT